VVELIQSISVTNQANGRRSCTRILNQWKKEIIPNLSKEESLELLILIHSTVGDGGDGNSANDCLGASDDSPALVVPTLLSIINNDHDFSTEGHRETSVDILKGLFHRAFSTGRDALQGEEEGQEEMKMPPATTLIQLFHQCSQTFQNRMARCQTSNRDGFRHGTMMEPMESSEHIRLLLVELLLDLGGYCLTSSKKDGVEQDDETHSKRIIEATSNICHILAKSTFLDPYPEVQRAACTLVEILARLCPLAVRMKAPGLLVPLTGEVDGFVGGAEQSSSISKKCLFRHRHAKTRCKAVDASAAIVMCCPREDSSRNDDGHHTDGDSTPANHLSSYGSQSTSMGRILQDNLLPGWEDLLKMDPSASVQIAVLKSLGNVAGMLDWSYSPDTSEISPPPAVSNDDHTNHSHQPVITSKMDLASMVEARVLTLFLMGLSVGNATQVQSMTIQQLRNLRSGNQQNLPRDTLVTYFQPILELVLSACSQGWAPCQSKVRSLETLQVLLGIAIPLMEKDASSLVSSPPAKQPSPECVVKVVELSNAMIRSIMDCLSENILSEEKEVLEAALASCRILGSSNHGSRIVLAITSTHRCRDGEKRSVLVTDDVDSVGDHSSPRQMTCILLMLDGMIKGSLCNKEATSIRHEIDPTLTIPTPDWFHSSPSSATIISSFLCHTTITNNVAANSSLAWALLDTCNSFVQCAQQPSQVDNEKLELTEDVITNVLISIAHLLGCPDEYGLSSHAMNILDAFSPFQGCAKSNSKHGAGSGGTSDAMLSLMDVHFRGVLPRIVASAPPFPWKQTDPAFLAMDALLRTCRGSTVGNNFDMVAPFFVSHLSTAAYNTNDNGTDSAHDKCLTATTTKDELAEEYSLRISLMALLQTILSDESFSQTLSPRQIETSTFSARFTTDVLLSLVLPNLVWKVGGMALALRKLAAATLFSLLSHYHNNKQVQQQEKGTTLLHPETITHLIPILHSNLEDTESTTRELSCICLSMVLEQVSSETFTTIWETNTRVIDTLYPRLLELLDDSHNPVRMAACKALGEFLTLAHVTASTSSFNLGLASMENIASSLLIQLDDPEHEIKEHAFQVLLVLLELQYQDSNGKFHENNKGVVEMMERQIIDSLKSHRDGSFCRLLLEKVHSKLHFI